MESIYVLSDVDRKLLSVLEYDARLSWADIGTVLQHTPHHLAARWERMRAAGAAWMSGHYSGRAAHQVMAFVEIQIKTDKRLELLEQLVNIPDVYSLDASAQDFDLVATVVAPSLEDLRSDVLEPIMACAGVDRIQTWLVSRALTLGADWRVSELDAPETARLHRVLSRRKLPSAAAIIRPEHLPALAELMKDSRITAAELARRTGLSASTASRHIAHIYSSSEVTFRKVVNPLLLSRPVTCTWFGRIPGQSLSKDLPRLAGLPSVRMLVTCSGTSNVIISHGLRNIGQIIETERLMAHAAPDMVVVRSTVTFRSFKRLGWVLDEKQRPQRYVQPTLF